MPIPLVAYAGGALVIAAFGASAGTYRGATNVSRGLEDGLRWGVPVAVGATALYLFSQRR